MSEDKHHNDFGAPPIRRSVSIEDMIAAEDDPKQRSVLIVLNSINSALVAHISMVRDMKDSFDGHLSQYAENARSLAEWQNQGRGAWRVMAWVLGIAQATVMATAMWVGSEIKDINNALAAIRAVDAAQQQQLKALEEKK